MTMWCPDLEAATRPKYVAIADALARAIEQRELAPGAQLPPQRDLARALSVTTGTVTRAYAEARKRGLVSGEVGRGTFVRTASTEPDGLTFRHVELPDCINLAHNAPHCGEAVLLEQPLTRWARSLARGAAFAYGCHAGPARAREAGAAWLRQFGVDARAEEIAITCGAQHAILVALAATAGPGDVLLAEALAYPGVKSAARLLQLRVEGVALDEHGMCPSALARACRAAGPSARAVYLTPTAQNPTATVMPEARRREIAAIADEHGVIVIEDDTYGFLIDGPPPLVNFAASGSYYLTGLSKCMAPGLRVGFLRRAGRLEDIEAILMASTVMASPVTADLAAELIEGGVAAELVARRRAEAARRQEYTRAVLGPWIADGVDPAAAHTWLLLPEPWRVAEFATAARARGVALAAADVFATGRAPTPHAVRLSLGAERDEARLQQGIDVVAELLAGRPVPAIAGP
ncbi:MAG: PLP-dependent aminotransferase family protein [Planctomycetota bacterium]